MKTIFFSQISRWKFLNEKNVQFFFSKISTGVQNFNNIFQWKKIVDKFFREKKCFFGEICFF
jgi:hypothetical protein